MSRKLYMCEPTYFDVEYQINPHMDVDVPVDTELARHQWETLKRVYEELGAEVIVMPAVEGLPDMTFAANCGHPVGKMFLRANFRYEVRRSESDYAAEFFRNHNHMVIGMDEHVYFEGQGDLIKHGDRYFMGYGFRSERTAADHLRLLTPEEVHPIQLVNNKLYHLDTCFGPIDDRTAVISRNAFAPEDQETIEDLVEDIIYTNEQDDSVLGCNLVAVGDTVVIGEGISDELVKAIEDRGLKVKTVPMSELLKSGGSVKCLTLEQY